ncbi:MAG: hypothetical protein IKU19_08515, partial [Clostridia bacterium]|nr:hypothetical protein [Clostridia bacterium]
MPTKKKNTTKKTYKKTSTKTPAKGSSKKSASTRPENSSAYYVMPWILALLAVFTAICLYFTEYSGFVGK